MNFKTLGLAAIASIGLATSAAQAGQINDYTISGYGWYDGSGNPNGAFTHNDDGNGDAIDLRVKGRQNPLVVTPVGNTYSVPTGAQPGNPARAWWNLEFNVGCNGCVNTNGSLAALLNISTMTATDLTAGVSKTVSMLTWLDDSAWDGLTNSESTLALSPLAISAQNSENPVFGDFPLNGIPGYTYDMFNNHAYNFQVDLKDANGNVFLSDNINVLVGSAELPGTPVPEPLTLSVFAAGLVGAGIARRRKKTA
jgi:hypothetical protein